MHLMPIGHRRQNKALTNKYSNVNVVTGAKTCEEGG